ncbi:hypothetical protein QAD02_013351 [Eretmocerus hayati]|uniref:Uncharacterized protein n=1 Tax=Eretmocerus hayati TaxID=131215 RepID=A0ACC2P2L9_9HYME|nr:hypothetical protein QAD02_013351 [Eretmocerus hayati]
MLRTTVDDISDAHNLDGNNPREKDGNLEDINVSEECTSMTTDKFQFVVLKLLKQIDKNCTEQLRELNRKLGSMSKRVGKLEKKVEAFGSTPATVVNLTHDKVKKYLKPATMGKFQDLEDMLKHSKFYNKLQPYCNLILILVKTKSRSLYKHGWTKRRTGPPREKSEFR